MPSSVSARCLDVAGFNYESVVSHQFDIYEFNGSNGQLVMMQVSLDLRRGYFEHCTPKQNRTLSHENENKIPITHQRPKVKNRKTDSRHEYK